MSIRVISKRSGGVKAKQGEVVIDISRTSPLGNPFIMRNESERSSVIAKYRAWIKDQMLINPSVQRELNRIAVIARSNDVALECWCAPCACHGDLIKPIIEHLIK